MGEREDGKSICLCCREYKFAKARADLQLRSVKIVVEKSISSRGQYGNISNRGMGTNVYRKT